MCWRTRLAVSDLVVQIGVSAVRTSPLVVSSTNFSGSNRRAKKSSKAANIFIAPDRSQGKAVVDLVCTLRSGQDAYVILAGYVSYGIAS